jgi:hypothetical protein
MPEQIPRTCKKIFTFKNIWVSAVEHDIQTSIPSKVAGLEFVKKEEEEEEEENAVNLLIFIFLERIRRPQISLSY